MNYGCYLHRQFHIKNKKESNFLYVIVDSNNINISNDNIRKDDALPLLASDEFASEYLINDDIDKKKEVAHLKNNLYFIPDEQQHKNH